MDFVFIYFLFLLFFFSIFTFILYLVFTFTFLYFRLRCCRLKTLELVMRINLILVDTRKLNKKLLLISTTIYTVLFWSMLQHYITNPKVYALSSCPITHPHVFFIRPPCFLHVPWHHTFNLHYICTHHMYTMRNHSLLMSSLTLTLYLDFSWSF